MVLLTVRMMFLVGIQAVLETINKESKVVSYFVCMLHDHER